MPSLATEEQDLISLGKSLETRSPELSWTLKHIHLLTGIGNQNFKHSVLCIFLKYKRNPNNNNKCFQNSPFFKWALWTPSLPSSGNCAVWTLVLACCLGAWFLKALCPPAISKLSFCSLWGSERLGEVCCQAQEQKAGHNFSVPEVWCYC